VTFLATLAFAPHRDNGILVGAGLAVGLFLYRTMNPRMALLGRFPDGTLRDLQVHPRLPRAQGRFAQARPMLERLSGPSVPTTSVSQERRTALTSSGPTSEETFRVPERDLLRDLRR
jgi:hypothetical protein